MAVTITGTDKGSVASKLNIPAGARLVRVGGEPINDVLDYGFYTTASDLSLEVELPGGEVKTFSVKKAEYEELGFQLETFLMDKQHSCQNDCIFCFISQLPKGLRETLYFKDDDERLSFLFGNYITLTNLKDEEVERIIKMHISPINISVHTTDPVLRCEMMHNRFAGEKLKYLYRLAEAGSEINCQIVLCRDVNDGDRLRKTLDDLIALWPSVRSVACVPAGLTAHREGLPHIEAYDKESALEVLDIVHEKQAICREKFGCGFVYPADELFLLAGLPIPEIDYYDDLPQLDNGVGMLAELEDMFRGAADYIDIADDGRSIDILTGEAAAPTLRRLVEYAKEKAPKLSCEVHAVKNDFFGGNVVVAGLITATDILAQFKDKLKGDTVLIPREMLRSEGDMFLDSITVEELSQQLGKNIEVIGDGDSLAERLLG